MNTTALFAEFLLIGIIPFFALVFFILAVFQVRNLNFLAQVSDYSALILFVATFVIYVFGAITHRLMSLINTESTHFMKRVPYFKRFWVQHAVQEYHQDFKQYFYIYQYGSDNLVKKLEYFEVQVRIFKAVTFTIPLLAASLSYWLFQQFGSKPAAIVLAGSIIAIIVSLVAFWHQRQSYRLTVRWMTRLIQESQGKIVEVEIAHP